MKYVLLVVFVAACSLDSGSSKNKCETQADCLDGNVCNLVTGVCEPPGQCTPAECDNVRCGQMDDGCGGIISCGCADPEYCGGGGTPLMCGVPAPHCTNGVQDVGYGETDRDCGGPCPACEVGEKCGDHDDCTTGSSCDTNVCTPGTWASVADMPTARIHASAVFGPDGLLYVIGGFRSGQGGGSSGVNEAYDPATNSWTTRAPLPRPRYGASAVVGSDNKIYVIGGQYDNSTSPSTDGPSAYVDAYNPTTNTWQAMPSLPNGRYHGAAAAATDGNIYVTGGLSVNPIETLGSVARFTPGGTAWTTLSAPMTTARQSHATVFGDGKLYAIGGWDSGANEIAKVEWYTPGAAGWNTAAPMMLARREHEAAFSGGKLYVIGGIGTAKGTSVEVYTPSTNTWSRVASSPMARWGHAVAVAPNGKIYVCGGDDPTSITSENTAKVDVFTP